jgi:hypothetical protein
MNEIRKQEIWHQIIADLVEINVGPQETVPVKTVWIRAMKRGLMEWEPLQAVLSWAVDTGLLTYTPGGIANLGSIALTNTGYEESRRS